MVLKLEWVLKLSKSFLKDIDLEVEAESLREEVYTAQTGAKRTSKPLIKRVTNLRQFYMQHGLSPSWMISIEFYL